MRHLRRSKEKQLKSNEFVGLLFLSRDFAHSAHLNTSSYAEHQALASFYSSLPDLADKYAEAYMGLTGSKIGPVALPKPTSADSPVSFLQARLLEIQAARDSLTEDSALQNIIDEIVELFYSTLYKLRTLK